MFALGIIALVQIGFLPGYLLVKALKLEPASWLGVLVVSFALSLVANSVIIFALTALGLYVRPVLVLLMLVEAALLVWLIARRRRRQDAAAPSVAAVADRHERPSIGRNPFAVLVLILSSCWFIAVAVRNIGTVFSEWDAVVSWNRWAVQWANNELPYLTWRYPQLVPTNWSISYVLMGADLQFFSKALMPLFALFVPALFLDLALRSRDTLYVWGFVATCILYRALLPSYVPAGYVEFAVAFLAFASVYCLLDAQGQADTPGGRRRILLGAVLAGGCAVTKQGGLFMLVAYPLLAYVLRVRTSSLPTRARWRLVGLCLACVLVVAAPWYIYKETLIAGGGDRSVLGALATGEKFHVSKAVFVRLAHGIGSIGKEAGGTTGLVAIAATLLLGLADRRSRWITCIIIVPFTLLWGFFFEYAVRNYSLALPFVGLACGSGIAQVWRLLLKAGDALGARPGRRLSTRARWIAAGVVGVVVASGLVVGSATLTGDRMRQQQDAKLRQIGRPDLNAMLYRAAASAPFEGKIITDYQLLGYLPELGQYKGRVEIRDIPEASYGALLAGTLDETYTYLLFSGAAYPRLIEAVRAGCRTGHCEVVGTCGSWYLVKIVGGRATASPARPDEPAHETR